MESSWVRSEAFAEVGGARGALRPGATRTTAHGEARAVARQLGIVSPESAELRGVAPAALRVAARDGALVRVRFGAYVEAESWVALDRADRYRLRVLAAAGRLRAAVFSHDSAAALWRLPRLGAWPSDVHVVVERAGGGRSSSGVRRHTVASVPEIAVIDRTHCTTAARTVVDVARTWDFAAALTAADHGLRTRIVEPDALADEVAAAVGGRGSRAARRVIRAASPLAESVGESLSRARMLELGLPAPVLQHEVRDRRELVARVDFWWEHLGLVGEFDGRTKYRTDGLADRRAVEERLWAEKQREDRLRALGLRVVRWTWADAWRRSRLARLLSEAGLHS